MADTNTPEQVAYRLLQHVANVEDRSLNGGDDKTTDRKYILTTYYECLMAVKGVNPNRPK